MSGNSIENNKNLAGKFLVRIRGRIGANGRPLGHLVLADSWSGNSRIRVGCSPFLARLGGSNYIEIQLCNECWHGKCYVKHALGRAPRSSMEAWSSDNLLVILELIEDPSAVPYLGLGGRVGLRCCDQGRRDAKAEGYSVTDIGSAQ